MARKMFARPSARAASRAEIKAIRALVKAMAARHPGQPVTVSFAEGSSPAVAVQVAVGLAQRQCAVAATQPPARSALPETEVPETPKDMAAAAPAARAQLSRASPSR